MYTAKKDFKYGLNKFKKGDIVKVSTSIAEKLIDNGDIELKKADAKKPKEEEK